MRGECDKRGERGERGERGNFAAAVLLFSRSSSFCRRARRLCSVLSSAATSRAAAMAALGLVALVGCALALLGAGAGAGVGAGAGMHADAGAGAGARAVVSALLSHALAMTPCSGPCCPFGAAPPVQSSRILAIALDFVLTLPFTLSTFS